MATPLFISKWYFVSSLNVPQAEETVNQIGCFLGLMLTRVGFLKVSWVIPKCRCLVCWCPSVDWKGLPVCQDKEFLIIFSQTPVAQLFARDEWSSPQGFGFRDCYCENWDICQVIGTPSQKQILLYRHPSFFLWRSDILMMNSFSFCFLKTHFTFLSD